jgi:hypothetical protein
MQSECQSESDKPGNTGAGKAARISRDSDQATSVLCDGTEVITRLGCSHTFAMGVLERMPSFSPRVRHRVVQRSHVRIYEGPSVNAAKYPKIQAPSKYLMANRESNQCDKPKRPRSTHPNADARPRSRQAKGSRQSSAVGLDELPRVQEPDTESTKLCGSFSLTRFATFAQGWRARLLIFGYPVPIFGYPALLQIAAEPVPVQQTIPVQASNANAHPTPTRRRDHASQVPPVRASFATRQSCPQNPQNPRWSLSQTHCVVPCCPGPEVELRTFEVCPINKGCKPTASTNAGTRPAATRCAEPVAEPATEAGQLKLAQPRRKSIRCNRWRPSVVNRISRHLPASY